MPHPTKIATCCYCSSRTLLKPSARNGHELACGSCGAPLHDMKWLKLPQERSKPKPQASRRVAHKPRKFKKKKSRKPLWQKGLEDAWDIIEDIFD